MIGSSGQAGARGNHSTDSRDRFTNWNHIQNDEIFTKTPPNYFKNTSGPPPNPTEIFQKCWFFAPRTASTTSKLASQNHLLKEFLNELHRKIHENTLKTTKTTPKLHQITQKTLLDHPRTRPKKFKIFDFFAPRTASGDSTTTHGQPAVPSREDPPRKPRFRKIVVKKIYGGLKLHQSM